VEQKDVDYYKAWKISGIGEKPIWVIVDKNGKTINWNPNKDELKGINKFPEKDGRGRPRPHAKYTGSELLDKLTRFENKNGRIPTTEDFRNNHEYPSYTVYRKMFGSWNKALEKAFGTKRNKYERGQYADEELLNELRRFEKEHGRPPTEEDFRNNPKYRGYPNPSTYIRHFGSWFNALIKAELNIDLMGPQCSSFRGRQAEIAILYHLENRPIDLSGKNWKSYCNAVDQNDGPYDVKSSQLYKNTHYLFHTENEDKDDDNEAIRWYYFVALNDDNTIKYVWKVPGEMVENDAFIIGINSWSRREFTIENMKEYDITDKFKLRIIEQNHI
jgi:hypothetical protein